MRLCEGRAAWEDNVVPGNDIHVCVMRRCILAPGFKGCGKARWLYHSELPQAAPNEAKKNLPKALRIPRTGFFAEFTRSRTRFLASLRRKSRVNPFIQQRPRGRVFHFYRCADRLIPTQNDGLTTFDPLPDWLHVCATCEITMRASPPGPFWWMTARTPWEPMAQESCRIKRALVFAGCSRKTPRTPRCLQ